MYISSLNLRKWISNPIPKFQNSPTVNKSGIIVLSRQPWVSSGKEKLQCEWYFSILRHVFVIPNGENVRKWFLNLVIKFHDYPTVNKYEIVVLLRQVWWYAGKRNDFGKRIGKIEFERKKRRRSYRQYDLTCRYL